MRLSHCTSARVEEYLKHRDTVVIPLGSIENHGRHIPLGTDTLIPEKIVELLDQRSDVMIAPMIPYGAADWLVGFPGTVSIGSDVLELLLTRITDNLYSYGFRRFIIVNGHGGNIKSIETVGLQLYQRGAYLANFNWWQIVSELNPEWGGGHGDAQETSGIMAVDPNLINWSELETPMAFIDDLDVSMPSFSWEKVKFKGVGVSVFRPAVCYNKNGWSGSKPPKTATQEWGQAMLEAVAGYIAEFIEAFEKVALPTQGESKR